MKGKKEPVKRVRVRRERSPYVTTIVPYVQLVEGDPVLAGSLADAVGVARCKALGGRSAAEVESLYRAACLLQRQDAVVFVIRTEEAAREVARILESYYVEREWTVDGMKRLTAAVFEGLIEDSFHGQVTKEHMTRKEARATLRELFARENPIWLERLEKRWRGKC